MVDGNYTIEGNMTQKELLKIRNEIFQKYGMPALSSVGFEKSPFPSDWFGRDNLNNFSYGFCRLNHSLLETIQAQIVRGDRWIKIILNLFELTPSITNLKELKNYDAVKYKIPPASLTEMRIHQDNYRGIPLFNPNFNRHRLKKSISTKGLKKSEEKLGVNIQRDLRDIDSFIQQWHTLNKPLKVDWNGRLFGIEDMTIEQRLKSASLHERFRKVVNKDVSEAERILRWLEVSEEKIKNTLKTAMSHE